MKVRKFLTVVSLIVSVAVPAAAIDSSEVNEAIDETFVLWEKAIRRGDAKAAAELATEDALFWSQGAPELKGRDALQAAFETVFQSWSMEQSFHEEERILGDGWAFFRGVETNVLTPKSGEGEQITVTQRAFGLLRRGDDGRWRFARGMTNMPAGN